MMQTEDICLTSWNQQLYDAQAAERLSHFINYEIKIQVAD